MHFVIILFPLWCLLHVHTISIRNCCFRLRFSLLICFIVYMHFRNNAIALNKSQHKLFRLSETFAWSISLYYPMWERSSHVQLWVGLWLLPRLRFCHRSDGRYGFEKKYFKLFCVLHSSSNENWFALSTNTVLATTFPTDFNSTLICFLTNCSKCCYIDTLFFQHVPHVENTFKYTNTYECVFC